jgi:hypothetical protein
MELKWKSQLELSVEGCGWHTKEFVLNSAGIRHHGGFVSKCARRSKVHLEDSSGCYWG